MRRERTEHKTKTKTKYTRTGMNKVEKKKKVKMKWKEKKKYLKLLLPNGFCFDRHCVECILSISLSFLRMARKNVNALAYEIYLFIFMVIIVCFIFIWLEEVETNLTGLSLLKAIRATTTKNHSNPSQIENAHGRRQIKILVCHV